MEIRKAIKLTERWGLDPLTDPYGDRPYEVIDFIVWLYKEGFTISSRLIGEDAEKQEELIDSKE